MEFEAVCIHASAFSTFQCMPVFFVVCLPPYLSMIRVLSLFFPVFLLLVHVFLHCVAEKLEIKVASGCNDLPDRFRAADPLQVPTLPLSFLLAWGALFTHSHQNCF